MGELFDLLGADRCAQITHVSADGADFIDTILHTIVTARCPGAVRVADPFHIVKGATDALDEVRPRADAPPRPGNELAKGLKGARYSLWKNPDNLTDHQQTKLAWIAATDPKLYRAYLLKAAQSGPAGDPHHASRRRRSPGAVGQLGPPVPHPGVGEAAEEHRQTPRPDPRRDRAPPVQRP